MSEIKQLNVNGTTYTLKDETARNSISSLESQIDNLETSSGSDGSTVSYTASLTSGTKVGTLTIDGTTYTLYAPTNTNTTYSAGTNMSLSSTTFSTSLSPYFNQIVIGASNSSTTYPSLSYGAYTSSEGNTIDVSSTSALTILAGKGSFDNNYAQAGLKIASCTSCITPLYYLGGASASIGGMVNLGNSTNRFGTVYCGSTNTSSDKNLKQNIQTINEDSRSDSYLQLFDDMDISTYKFKDYDSSDGINPYTAENHKRTHIGLIAQELETLQKTTDLSANDFCAVKSEFFCPPMEYESSINGGWQIEKDGYSYSENAYNYKHSFDEENPTEYHTYNELIGKPVSSMNIASYRSNIQYLHITDNSKLTKNQPPVKINAVIFEKEDGTQLRVDEFTLDGNVCDYCPNSVSYEDDYYTGVYNRSDTPMSSATINDDGSITVNFDRMYGTYLIKLFDEPIDITEYETVYFDVDYISEYKFILYPEGTYLNSEWGDREYNDQIIYNYSIDYNELFNLSMYALQETRKELADAKSAIDELKSKVDGLTDTE